MDRLSMIYRGVDGMGWGGGSAIRSRARSSCRGRRGKCPPSINHHPIFLERHFVCVFEPLFATWGDGGGGCCSPTEPGRLRFCSPPTSTKPPQHSICITRRFVILDRCTGGSSKWRSNWSSSALTLTSVRLPPPTRWNQDHKLFLIQLNN